MAGRRILYLIAVAGGLVFYGFYREWFSWFFLTAMLCFPFFSLLLSLPGMLTARAVIRCPAEVPLGAEAAAELDAVCALPTPPFRGRLGITHAISGEAWVIKSGGTLPAGLCGQLRLEALRPRIFDYLGLFRLPLRRNSTAYVLVLPEPVPIDRLPDFARLPARQWKRRPGGGFSEHHELRLYRPGDSLQQIHWKLSAKTGSLILREAMEPARRRVRLSLDLSGCPAELNRKLGQLLWLGQYLLERQVHFEIAALTGLGILRWQVESGEELRFAVEQLLASPAAASSSLRDGCADTFRQFHIGGDGDEA